MGSATRLIIILIPVIAGLPAPAVSARKETAGQSGVGKCVAVREGNPRQSEGIGIVFGSDVPREVVEEAVALWSRCREYRIRFPAFLIGRPGSQTIEVRFETAYKRRPRCGSFVGRSIVLYAFAVDGRGRLRSCGSPAHGLAHELGHLLGLLDAPDHPACFDYAMAQVDVTDRHRREIQPEECRAVDERWLTAGELVPTEEPTLLTASSAGGG